jgi:hypothetical protein
VDVGGFRPWAIVMRWRQFGAFSGDRHLDDAITRGVQAALSTIYPTPSTEFLAMAQHMPARWDREEQAGAAVSAHIEDWVCGKGP